MAQTFGFGDLLQSKMMANSNSNVNNLSSANNDDEDAYDLSLGLSLGVVEKHKDECDNESHHQKKKEFQAIRRQKVRQKREEKHLQQQQHRTKPNKRKGSPMPKTRCAKKDRRSAECCDAGGEICTAVAEEDKCSEMSSSNPHSGVSDGVVTKQPTFPILPIAYPYPPPMPVPMGYSFPYMMPFWSSAATDHCKSSLVTVPPVPVLQPVGSRAFPLFTPPPPAPWMTASAGHENGRAPSATASSGKSSSAVSDYDSLSSQGCSSQENDNENESKSQTSTVEPPTRLSSVSNLTALEHGSSEPSGASTNPTDTDAKPTDTDIKAESPIREDEKEDRRLMMPNVTTIGADGKTVKGYLYSYSKGEVSIMCVCHNALLTPAEFVKHAGRTDYEHPERHIVVSAPPPPALRSTPVTS